jgi:hypothetical protein
MDAGSNNDLSGTSPDGNGRTPNSSTTGTSDPQQQRQNLAPPGNVGHVSGGSGRNSFETSPVSSHQNLSSMSGTTPSDVERNVNAFFGADPATFGMPAGVSTGMTPDQRFSMPGTGEFGAHPASWADMAGQPGMTPVTEGVFRSMMGMGMDGMEMGWEPSA